MQKLFLIAALTIALPFVAQAQEAPRTEVFAGYSYMRLEENNGLLNQDRDLNGYNVSTNVTVYKNWLGFTADISGHFGDVQQNIFPQTNQGQTFFLAGPQATLRKFKRFQPFAHGLAGVGRLRTDNLAVGLTQTVTNFAFGAGGGVDLTTPLGPKVAVRLFQADYIRTRFNNTSSGNLRASTGIVIRLGAVE